MLQPQETLRDSHKIASVMTHEITEIKKNFKNFLSTVAATVPEILLSDQPEIQSSHSPEIAH